MKVIDLLKEIEKGKINESIFYVNGDFFYDLIVIDKNLYVINTMTKQLELLQSKYISKFIRDNVELLRLDNFEEIIEEEKKIPEKHINNYGDLIILGQQDNWLEPTIETDQKINVQLNPYVFEAINENFKDIKNKINEIIDYLKSKGDE